MSVQTLSASRAGAGSAVVADDPATQKTVAVAGVGIVATPSSTLAAPPSQPMITMVM